METTEITTREEAVHSPSRPPRRSARAWVGGVVCAALAGTLVVHGAIDHGDKATRRDTVTTVNPVRHLVGGPIGTADGSREDPGIGLPDSPGPTVFSPVDSNRSADQVTVNNSGGD